jgi:glycosyltransferase involved in cell wall biosynthesis
MKILYDGQVYSQQNVGGISRYFNNIIARLPATIKPYMIIPDECGGPWPRYSNLRVITYGKSRLKHISWRLNTLAVALEKRYIEYMATSNRYHVAHPTYYSLVTRRHVRDYRCPVVLTVYDMIHDLFPDRATNTAAEIDQKRKAVMAAQKVICISESTKKDLLDLYRVPERKVTVVHLSSGIDASLVNSHDPTPSKPYYLYVGSRAKYKNFDNLLRAFKNGFGMSSDMTLCVVGEPFTRLERQLIEELNLSNRLQYYCQVSDSHLATLYRQSVAFVYPSLYEGFGIPLLEAMACGTPVVASNCSSIPEVVGDAAVLFNPLSIGELTDALLSLSENEPYRKCLINKGEMRAKKFSWDKTVEQTVNVYRSV